MAKKKAALGRGLSALLENADTDITSRYTKEKDPKTVGSVALISIESIEVNPFQPRSRFEQEALDELAESIKHLGIIQPITVRKMGYDKFQLISGERRFRASQLAGLKEIPAYVRIANDQSMLEMAIVENIQRENLDAIEVALSYKRLIEECNLTQEELAEKVGKKRTTVTNYLRMLKLPEEIQAALIRKKISMGHARALLGTDDKKVQLNALKKILLDELSVRAVEEMIRRGSDASAPAKKPVAEVTETMRSVQSSLSDRLGVKVGVKPGTRGNGKIEIPFKSESELKKLLARLEND